MSETETIIRGPYSREEMDGIYDLRWRVLREPYGEPRGSETDHLDEPETRSVIHKAALVEDKVVSAGRIHEEIGERGLWIVRYMATDPTYRGSGLGAQVLGSLEHEARQRGAAVAELNANEAAVDFYRILGYSAICPAMTRFGIPHTHMRKQLTIDYSEVA